MRPLWLVPLVFLICAVAGCTSYHCTATGTYHTELRPVYGYHISFEEECAYSKYGAHCSEEPVNQPYVQYWIPVQVPDERCTETK